ncbi:MAG: DUF1318 domain-containing protein [Delftia acidovorans]|nr:DUF1318 domain-containing protein [Delftia acidovorans]
MRIAHLPLVAAALLLGACQGTQFMTAAGGTQVQAREVVRLVNGESANAAQVPYRSGDILPAIERIQTRRSQLRPAFESGVIGLTGDGWVAFRDPAARIGELARLVARENLDRHILYSASALEVGHGSNDWFGDWMPYQHATFGAAWVASAPEGWWVRGADGAWVKKSSIEAPRR